MENGRTKILWDMIRLEDLPRESRQVAEAIGLEAFLRLVEARPGCTIYIPTGARLIMDARDQEIRRRRAEGQSARQIAEALDLSLRQVYKIVGGARA